jgi:hypothetical protein
MHLFHAAKLVIMTHSNRDPAETMDAATATVPVLNADSLP